MQNTARSRIAERIQPAVFFIVILLVQLELCLGPVSRNPAPRLSKISDGFL
jgi:hypothetical protein